MPRDEQTNEGANRPNPKRRRFLRFLLGFAFPAILIVCGGVYYFWFCVPIGSGPAGPEVKREAFQKPWSARPVLLVGIGDSVTAGFGARKNYSYFDLLITNPPDDFEGMRGICLGQVLPGLKATNLAISGSTSFEHLEKELPRLAKQDPNMLGIVVITTGGNDLIHNYGRTAPSERAMYGSTMAEAKPWIEKFDRRLEAMLGQITNAFPGGCQIFMADIFDPTDGVGDIQRAGLPAWKDGLAILKEYNEIIHRFAARHPQVHVVEMHDMFLGHGIHCTQFWQSHYDLKDPHYWYFVNLEDPNERGYDVIRRLFLTEMAKSLAAAK